MKVGYILSTSAAGGGANRSLLDMIQQMKKNECEFSCFVILNKHGDMEDKLNDLGVKYYVQHYARATKSKSGLKTVGKRIFNIYAARQIQKIFRQEKPDIVHNNSLPTTIGMEVASKMNIPYICHVRENVRDGLNLEFYAQNKVKKIINDASQVIVISEYVKKYLEGICQNRNTETLNDGLMIDNYLIPNKKIFQEKRVNILMAGGINPMKGQSDAIRAVEKLNENGYDVCLTILGSVGSSKTSQEYANGIKRYVSQRELSSIRFMESITDIEKLKRLRSKYDINLMCSSAEALGRVTIEGMLSGALVIGANAGGTPEIISDRETGLLYSLGNVDELVKCVEWAVENPERGREIARNGQIFAMNKFSIELYCEKIYDIYEQTIQSDEVL